MCIHPLDRAHGANEVLRLHECHSAAHDGVHLEMQSQLGVDNPQFHEICELLRLCRQQDVFGVQPVAHDFEDIGVGVWQADLADLAGDDTRLALGDVENVRTGAEEELVDVESPRRIRGADDENDGLARGETGVR